MDEATARSLAKKFANLASLGLRSAMNPQDFDRTLTVADVLKMGATILYPARYMLTPVAHCGWSDFQCDPT